MLDSLTHMFLLVQYTLLLSFLDILWLPHALVYISIQNSFWKFMYVNQLPEILFIFKSGFIGISFHMHVCLCTMCTSLARGDQKENLIP